MARRCSWEPLHQPSSDLAPTRVIWYLADARPTRVLWQGSRNEYIRLAEWMKQTQGAGWEANVDLVKKVVKGKIVYVPGSHSGDTNLSNAIVEPNVSKAAPAAAPAKPAVPKKATDVSIAFDCSASLGISVREIPNVAANVILSSAEDSSAVADKVPIFSGIVYVNNTPCDKMSKAEVRLPPNHPPPEQCLPFSRPLQPSCR